LRKRSQKADAIVRVRGAVMPSGSDNEVVRVYVGLGSNLGDRQSLISGALSELDAHAGIHLRRRSSFYSSRALGVEEQPDFINAVAELDCSLSAVELLSVLLATELKGGRARGPVRWGARTIDLDLLLFGREVIRQPGLEVPHPRMHLRAFVLLPLLELDPEIVIPGIGSARKYYATLEKQVVEKIV
jgi:2-amino-4-hydroxy-6-hydroxymethyldihydropteridine diphosphokinase